jgi:cysteine desulfurase
MDRFYLDYAATTPLDPQVLEAMSPYFTQVFGNPSSNHYFGQQAEGILEECRAKIANLLGAHPEDVLFTASGSEGDNLAVKGAAFAQRAANGADTILISPVEHPAVANSAKQLRDVFGFKLIELKANEFGAVSADDLREKLAQNRVAVVSVIYANNEIGTINDVETLGAICETHQVPFHSDAVQACAYLPIDLTQQKINLLSFTGHKFYGPKGAGALIFRNTALIAHTSGGKQEHKLRAGTHNVPGIVGLTRALELALQHQPAEVARLTQLRDRIINTALNDIPGSRLTGDPVHRLPNHVSLLFEGISGNDLVIMLDMAGFACSSGSACKVGDPKPSKVILALGFPYAEALGTLRITLGKGTTENDIDRFLEYLPVAVKKLRK